MPETHHQRVMQQLEATIAALETQLADARNEVAEHLASLASPDGQASQQGTQQEQ